jgi:ribosomal protein S18 acetylase RimI-like enzyme
VTEAAALQIGSAQASDEPFLREMLLEAAFPPCEPRPRGDPILDDPRLRRYMEDWGRKGDAGVIATVDGIAVGAAWYRRFTADKPGYGFVRTDIPEVGMAIAAPSRGRGIGRALIEALIQRARDDRIPALRLSVSAANRPAFALYRSVGFRSVGGDEQHPTMLLRLAE